MATTCKLIAKVTVGSGGAAEIEFTNIPGTYTDLLLLTSLREETQVAWTAYMQFNGDTGSNYSDRYIQSNGATVTSATASGAQIIFLAVSSGATASTFGNSEIYIPNYAGSTNKSVSITSITETNATTAYIRAEASLWSSGNAITSLKIFTNNATDWAQHSTAYLYGITKA